MATEFISNSWLMPTNANAEANRVSNYSLDFDDASSQYVETSSNVGISGSQSRTMSVWLKGGATNNGKNWPMAVAIGAGSTDKAMWIGGGGGPSAYWYFGWWGSPSSTSGDIDSGVRMDADNDWHMLTSTYDESTQIAKGYIDGVEVASFSRTGINTTDSVLKIGKHLVSSVYWDGPITQVSIYDYSLSATQVLELYGTGSAIGNPMAITNGRKPINYYPLGNAAFNGEFLASNGAEQDYVFDFEGPNANEQFITTTYFPNGESNFTYSTWVNCNFYQKGTLIAAYGGSTHQNFYISFWTSTGGIMYVFVGAGVYAQFNNFALHGYSINEWTNISLLYDGTFTDADSATQNAGRLKLYINGNYEAFDSFVGTIPSTIPSGNTGFYLGTTTPTTYEYGGKMSNVSVFNTSLPATGTESINSLYNNGTPPNIASYSNLQGWWELDASATFDGSNWSIPDASSNSNTGTSSGMTAASLTQSNLIINQSYDPFSLLFDGSNDYIDCGNDSSLQIFTNSHTQSFWINTSGFSQGYIGGYGVDSVIIYFSNNTIRFYTKGLAQPDFYSNTVLSVNQWNHIVCTYDSGGDKKIYINGNLDNTISTSGSITTEGVGYTIAARNLTGTISNYFDGSISNGSIYSSALSAAQVKTLYNEGKPFDLNTFEVTPVAWWRLGSVNSSYNSTTSEWTVLDEIGTNNGTGSNLGPAQTALSDGVGATGSGTSSGMGSGENRKGSAPFSESNSVSYNMSVLAKSSSVPT